MEEIEERVQNILERIEQVPRGDPLWVKHMSYLSYLEWNLYLLTSDLTVLDECISTGLEAVNATARDDPDHGARLSEHGSRLGHRYSMTGAEVDLEEAMCLTREAVQLIPNDHPARATVLVNHGVVLSQSGYQPDLEEAAIVMEEATGMTEDCDLLFEARKNLEALSYAKYRLSGEVADLEQAIKFARLAIDSIPNDSERQAIALGNLFVRQRDLYLETKTSDALAEAVRTAQQALDLTPKDHPQYAVSLTNYGTALFNRYELSGARVDLENSIQHVKCAIALLAEDDPLRAHDLRNLTDRLGQRFRITGALEDIQESVEVGIEALAATPRDHPETALFSSNVALRLAILSKETQTLPDLEQAIEAATKALNITNEMDPWWGQLVNNLGYLLGDRYSRVGRVSDLHKAIHLGERCVESTFKDHESRSERIMNLATNIRERYAMFGVAADIRKAVALAREALAGLRRSDTDRMRFQSSLGLWLGDLSLETDQSSDLEEGIRIARLAYNESLPDQQSDFNCSANLSKLLSLKGGSDTKTSSMDEAIHITRKALACMPKSHPNRQMQLVNLASYLGSRYQERGESSDLDNAIKVAREALDLTERSSSAYFETLNNTSTLLGTRYSRSGNPTDLFEAIKLMSGALKDIEDDNPVRTTLLNNMANRMSDQYARTGDITNLEDAIRFAREASETDLKSRKSRALRTLGTLLGERFLAKGELADINKSVELLEHVVADTPANHPDRSSLLSNLGIRLGERYARTGAIGDLDKSILYIREAVDKILKGHVDWVGISSNLAARLGERYTRVGRMSDLDDAIRIGRDLLASDAIGLSNPNRSVILNNLGIRLSDRYTRTGRLEDLDEAIRHATESLDALPSGHADLAGRLQNLGTRLNERYRKTAEDDDYVKSMGIGRRAVQAAPLGHPLHSACLKNVGGLLLIRFQQTEAFPDLEESIRILREAVDSSPKDHPDHAERLGRLGDALGESYVCTKDLNALDEAISCHQSAANQGNAALIVRIKATRQLLRDFAVRSQWKEALQAAEAALNLLPQLVLRSLDNSDKQHLLGQVAGLACEAASTAIMGVKSPMTALKLLEQGRGILATSIEDMRTDIMDLHSTYPALANQFVDCKELFERVSSRNKEVADSTQVSQQYEAERRFDDVIRQIRTKSGFEDFLLAPSISKMVAASLHGPIIIINISMFNCGAITIDARGEWAVSLPHVTKNDIDRRARFGNLDSLETLEWLWDVIAKPILDHLGLTHTPTDGNWTHIWWIPTGALCKFPLHAAGYHLRNTGETVMDRAISSYSSSVKALISSRRAPAKQPVEPKALLVAIEKTPGYVSLPFAHQEVEAIRGICTSMNLSVMEPRRQKANVQRCLQECSIFHFAGHGHTDESDPSMSHLLLEEGQQNPLTVGELLEMSLRKSSPFLAYLSACGTGRLKDDRFADEGLHLIGACQVAGFRHVIGTLWKVQDDLCMDVARGIYESLRDNGIVDDSVGQGLHQTVRILRDRWLEMRPKRNLKPDDIENCHRGDGLVRESALVTGEQQRVPRDVVIVEGEFESELYWVPYVHFGV